MLKHREECLQKALPVLDVHPFVIVMAVQQWGRVQRNIRRSLVMQGVSYAVMAISAFAVARPLAWVMLGCVAVFLFWLIGFHVPTASAKGAE
ncbi:hypothetical protein [uncultured Senegalimassilia sp.]|uniref:hypothetical protein n=1 Tax=uncultured Senegalimassilia sp. TaxID=1714350 RepID=UPI0025F86518|nr:hypothetical protein [uncultured Senegalimassilia sp.]